MGIYAIARGEVVAEPATVTTDAGTATVMVAATAVPRQALPTPPAPPNPAARPPTSSGPTVGWSMRCRAVPPRWLDA